MQNDRMVKFYAPYSRLLLYRILKCCPVILYDMLDEQWLRSVTLYSIPVYHMGLTGTMIPVQKLSYIEIEKEEKQANDK